MHRGTPKEAKMSFLFFFNRMAFFHVFLHAISFFFNSLSILPAFQKQHFARIKCIGVPQKEEKCKFFFSLIERHFFMYFYMPFYLFKVPFDFASLSKAAFCKDKAHRATPKGAKMSLLFSLNKRLFLNAFLRAISFFQSPFPFCVCFKSSIFQS